MTISFNQIPSALRVPLFYAEFDNTRAVQGGATQIYRTLLVGQMLSTGTKAALSGPHLITSEAQADEYFGIGSVLADMVRSRLAVNKFDQLWCVPIAELGGGVTAAGTFTVAGTPTKAGTISLMVAGRNIKVGVALTDTPTTIAAAIAAAIVADSKNIMTSTSALGVATVTAKNKGEHGNEVDLRHSYFLGEELPPGITVAVVQPTGGAGNPDMDTVWPVIGEVQYLLMVTPFTDASNMAKVETELDSRFGPIRGNDGFALYGKRATHGALVTFGGTRNSVFSTVMMTRGPSSPWQIASALSGQVSASAGIDPARPFQTLHLAGIHAPSQSEHFTLEERNILLFNGIATFDVDAGGRVLIEAVITTYKENAFGSPDESYLYLNTPLTLSYLRFDLKARITLRFPRHKLANDGTRFAPGQAVVTPGTMKAEVVAKFMEWEEKALVEGFDQFVEELIVERNSSNPNRLDILLPPDLVNQLRIAAGKIQFLL